MNREEKIVWAVRQTENGCPLRDFLTDIEIEEAISMLADVLMCVGVPLLEDNE